MPPVKGGFVYIMTNKPSGTLYCRSGYAAPHRRWIGFLPGARPDAAGLCRGSRPNWGRDRTREGAQGLEEKLEAEPDRTDQSGLGRSLSDAQRL